MRPMSRWQGSRKPKKTIDPGREQPMTMLRPSTPARRRATAVGTRAPSRSACGTATGAQLFFRHSAERTRIGTRDWYPGQPKGPRLRAFRMIGETGFEPATDPPRAVQSSYEDRREQGRSARRRTGRFQGRSTASRDGRVAVRGTFGAWTSSDARPTAQFAGYSDAAKVRSGSPNRIMSPLL